MTKNGQKIWNVYNDCKQRRQDVQGR